MALALEAARLRVPRYEAVMNQSPEVLAWLESYDNPMNEVVRRVRDIIVHADPRLEESLEGGVPTYSYRGSLATFFPDSKKHASLMVPAGAQIPGHHPRLEGSGEISRHMKIASVADANAAKDDLQHLVRAWCDWRDAAAESHAPVRMERKAARPRTKATKKASKPAAKKTRRPAAKKKARSPAATKARKPAAKKARKPAPKKARKPAAKKARKRA
jgi:hypothetical protein